MDRRTIKDGEQFNHWTVIGFCKQRKRYIAKCICGKVSYVSGWSMKGGRSKSCGCRQKDSVASKIVSSKYKTVRKKIFENYERAAHKRDYEFQLSFELFSDLITKKCHYCKLEPNMVYTYGRYNKVTPNIDYSDFKYNGIDRVDNSIGYIPSNCVPCCKICNNSKSTLTEDEWLDWVKRIYHVQFMEGSTTIPNGSRNKYSEMDGIFTENKDDDIV